MPSVEEDFAASSSVFVGVAEEVRLVKPGWLRWPARPEPQLGIRVRFRVLARWKGEQRDTELVWTPTTGAACGHRFEQGSTYLVYARSGSESPALRVYLCSCAQVAGCLAVQMPEIGPPVWQAPGQNVTVEFAAPAEPLPPLPCVDPPRLKINPGFDWPLKYPCIPVDMVVGRDGTLTSFRVNLDAYEERCESNYMDQPLVPLPQEFLDVVRKASSEWVFSPGSFGGKPVATRVLSLEPFLSPIRDGWDYQ